VVARAQQPDRLRRIGVLMAFDETDPEGKARLSAFTQALAELGWTDGRNVRMDVRWAAVPPPLHAQQREKVWRIGSSPASCKDITRHAGLFEAERPSSSAAG
jgi:hypothetical protein